MNSRDERPLFSIRDTLRATEEIHASRARRMNRGGGVLSWVLAAVVAVPVTFAVVAAVGFVTLPASADNPRSALVASASDAFSNAAETVRDILGRLFRGETETFQAVTKNSPVTDPAPPIVSGSQPSISIPAATTTIVYQTIQQPIIERVVETQRVVTQGGISETTLADRLGQLENKIRSLIFSQGSQQSAQTSAVYNAVALSQRIDNLSNVTLTNPTITGGSVTATAFSGTLGIASGGTGVTDAPSYGQLLLGNSSGGYTLTATSSLGLGGSGANTGVANSWTALQLFSAGASSTLFSNFGTAYFGGTATTTIDSAGNIVGAGTLSAGTTTVTSLVSTNTSTSTFAGGVQVAGFNLTGGATSTAANGFNIASGCFAVNGTCISGGGGASAWGSITGTLSSQADLQSALDAKLSLSNWYATTTTALAEGSNLYFTTSRVASVIAGTTTDALAQGTTNKYWSNTLFDNRLSATTTLSNLTTLANLSSVGTITSGTWSGLFGTVSGANLTGLTAANISAGTAGINISGNAGTVTNGVYTTGAGTVFLAPSGSAAALTSFPTFNQNTTGSAATLTTSRNINGVAFNGSADITIAAASSTLLADSNTFSGLTTFGNATSTLLSYTTAWGGTLNLTTALAVGNGGTGATSLTGILKGNGTSAFTAASAGTDYVAPATTITAGAGLSGGGDLSTSRTLTLNLANTNSWTGLQTFANSSSTLASVFNTLYVGGSATTTIQGNTTGTSTIQGFLNVAGTNSTSTFSGALASTYLNLTGTAATSTAANGFNLTAGCFSILGTCVGGGSSQWTTSGSNIYYTAGSVLIGTTTPGRMLTVFDTSANPQQRISYDATRYAELYADASGALNLTTTGKILNFLDGNLYLCDGGACPTTPVQGYPAFTSQGNLVAGGTVYAGAFGPVSCPSGMIPVPASPADGQQGFCVDKYEAQSSAGNEVSVSGGSPWVSITQTSARAECIRAGKHLITEKEWLTIAHNAENVGWNWNGGVAGTNFMSDGHSDNVPASALATAADASACSGTGQTCDLSTWNSQRRVYKLSNDEYIWDLGGNVWEWVDQTVTNDYPIVNSAAAGWQACSTSGDGVCGNTRTTNDQWHRGGFATIAGFLRGGYWSSGAGGGAFSLSLGVAPSSSGTLIGFRCAR